MPPRNQSRRPPAPDNRPGRTNAKKGPTPRQLRRRKTRRIILFIVEIAALLIMSMWIYASIKTTQSGRLVINEAVIVVNETVREYSEAIALKGYRNIALFGVDSTVGKLGKGERSDGIIIVSINQDSGDIRLVSVYRDNYLNIGNDSYNKCNAAYARGGAEQAMNMLNMNLDLNINEFVTIGFRGVAEGIDELGGVMIEITDAELLHINSYQLTMANELKRDYVPVTQTGLQLLDGLQAMAYCRIRYTAGDDFRRAERQRDVLTAVFEAAKKAKPAQLSRAADKIFASVLTSFELTTILELLADIAKYNIVDDAGFPAPGMRTTGTIGSKGSCIVPLDLAENAIWLHEFLFGGEDYTPSQELRSYSEKIKKDTAAYVK